MIIIIFIIFIVDVGNVVFRFCYIFWQAGKLEIYDISAGQLLESVDAHDGPVWSVSLASDKVCTFCASY